MLRRFFFCVGTAMLAGQMAFASDAISQNQLPATLIEKHIKEALNKLDSPERRLNEPGPHWLHLDNPGQTLRVQVLKSHLDGNKATATINLKGKLAFNYQVELVVMARIPPVVGPERRIVVARHDFGGYADAELTMQASAKLGPQVSEAVVSIQSVRISNLRMRSDLAKQFDGAIEAFVNGALHGNKAEVEKKLAVDLNTIKL